MTAPRCLATGIDADFRFSPTSRSRENGCNSVSLGTRRPELGGISDSPRAEPAPAAFLDSRTGIPHPRPLSGNLVGPSLKAGKPLFERGNSGPKIIPACRQCSGEDRIRSVEGVKHPRAFLCRGNVGVEKLGASIEISDECTDPGHFP